MGLSLRSGSSTCVRVRVGLGEAVSCTHGVRGSSRPSSSGWRLWLARQWSQPHRGPSLPRGGGATPRGKDPRCGCTTTTGGRWPISPQVASMHIQCVELSFWKSCKDMLTGKSNVKCSAKSSFFAKCSSLKPPDRAVYMHSPSDQLAPVEALFSRSLNVTVRYQKSERHISTVL